MDIQKNSKAVPPVTEPVEVPRGTLVAASTVSGQTTSAAEPTVRQGSPTVEALIHNHIVSAAAEPVEATNCNGSVHSDVSVIGALNRTRSVTKKGTLSIDSTANPTELFPGPDLPPVERHPFEPFLPENAKVLMLGSFPPQAKRWSMEFYYPNFINDMWRILGLIFFGDKNRFVDISAKKFKLEEIVDFCTETGIAMYDTATAVRRLKDNASDKFLEVVTPTDIPALLMKIPKCQSIVTTGEKATDTLCKTFGISAPSTGEYSGFHFEGRSMRLYRMPSSSRAYPLSLDKKAAAYRRLFSDLGMV